MQMRGNYTANQILHTEVITRNFQQRPIIFKMSFILKDIKTINWVACFICSRQQYVHQHCHIVFLEKICFLTGLLLGQFFLSNKWDTQIYNSVNVTTKSKLFWSLDCTVPYLSHFALHTCDTGNNGGHNGGRVNNEWPCISICALSDHVPRGVDQPASADDNAFNARIM